MSDKPKPENTAFLTGSRVYGKPRDDSDIDLVVSVSSDDAAILWELTDDVKRGVRFGRLNLIITTHDSTTGPQQYRAWREGTERLRSQRPVSRETAVSVMKEYGVSHGEYEKGEGDG